MLNAGQMRQLVRLDRRSATLDAAGGQVEQWLFFAERRAEIERTTGKEVWASQVRNGRVPTVFHLRFLADVVPEMRLTCNGTVYDIVSAIDPDGMRAELIITAEEHVEETPT